MSRCARCGKVGNLSVCSCKQVSYCTKACQKLHWRLHRPNCSSKKPKRSHHLIRAHMEEVAYMQRTSGLGRKYDQLQVALPGSQKLLPFGSLPADLTPVAISNLIIGTTHKGRVLRGKVVVPPVHMSSTHTVLQDHTGTLVKLSLYNTSTSAAGRLLSKNSLVGVVEPFYKIAADGKPMIRVDNPREVMRIQSLEPDTVAEWHAQGNRHFVVGELWEAKRCFTNALARREDSVLLATCLRNLALATSKASQGQAAFLWAAVATRLGGGAKATRLVEQMRKPLKLPKQLLHVKAAVVISLAADCEHERRTKEHSECEQREKPAKCDTAEANRLEGNRLFRSGAFEAACAQYRAGAFALLSQRVTKILSNRAACHLRLGEAAEAALDATAALCLIDPFPGQLFLKLHIRRITALVDLGVLEAAERAIKTAQLDCSSFSKDVAVTFTHKIGKLSRRVQSAIAAAEVAKRANPPLQRAQPPIEEAQLDGSCQMFNQIMSLLGGAVTGGVNPVNNDVPAYHLEMAQLGAWPKGCDVGLCMKLLSECYEMERSNLHEVVLVGGMEIEFPTIEQVQKRLHMRGCQDKLRWWADASHGDIFLNPTRTPYHETLVHNFTNVSNTELAFTTGTVHVAIGFVDLGSLQHARLVDGAQPGPLRWKGYEASAFCVAKTLVIAEMLERRVQASAMDVVQVWYSSTWSTSAHRAFREALTVVLETGGHSPEVTTFLGHWQVHDVSAKTALGKWQSQVDSGTMCSIGIWKLQEDRIALSVYLLSGQVGEDGTQGSITMFSHPPSFPTQRERGESAITTIPFSAIIAERSQHEDMMAAATSVLLAGVQRLMERVQTGVLVVEVTHALVTPQSSALLRDIAALRPWTVSWSNVCDYLSLNDFHTMARALSGEKDTLHFAYSMNWHSDVKGTSPVDIPVPKSRADVLATARDLFGRVHKKSGADKWVSWPPRDNPLNICGALMARTLAPKWTDHFMQAGGVPQRQVGHVNSSLADPLSRRASVLSLSWTYDPKVEIQKPE